MDLPGTELVKALSDRLAPFTDPVLSEAGGYIADRIRFLRFRNGLRAWDRAEAMLRAAGLKNEGVDLKLLVPILEGASLEEEDSELVEKWAGLLASAATGGAVLPAFPSILRELSGDEAHLLSFIQENHLPVFGMSGAGPLGVFVPELRGTLAVSAGEFRVRMLNLERLGLVHQLMRSGIDPVNRYADEDEGAVGLSALGCAFILACDGPSARA